MRELELRTLRVRRSLLERLRGYDRVYETKVTDGERAAYGRGASREASEQAAKKLERQVSRPRHARTGMTPHRQGA